MAARNDMRSSMRLSILMLMTVAALVKDTACNDPENQGNPRKILVFGGNGFIGADAVKLFIDNKDDVTLVNRGNWYWDSATRIRPFVKTIYCDRRQDIDSCGDLVDLVRSTKSFDAVVDFSAYGPKETREASSLLKGKAKLYILLSSDSIYEVCEKTHGGLTKETDDVRGTDDAKMNSGALGAWNWDSFDHTLAHQDPEYGSNKQYAENELVKQRMRIGGIPYVFLRISDVIGPRDSTFRWWVYQILAKLESHPDGKSISIPSFLADYKLSMVYSPDVARLIMDLLKTGPSIYDQAFNVAFPETFTLADIITSMRTNLGIQHSDLLVTDNQAETIFVFPSVKKGPVNVSKVQTMVGWKPTQWATAVRETVTFFEQAMQTSSFEAQRKAVLDDFAPLQLYWSDQAKLYSALSEVYNIDLKRTTSKTEL